MRTFFILGFIFTIGLWVYERNKWPILIRLIFLFFIIILFGFFTYILKGDLFLGDSHWYNISPYREIALFMIMVIGIVASTLNRAIKDRRQEIAELKKHGGKFTPPKLSIDRWECFAPFLSSLITFGGLLNAIGDKHLGLLTIILAFQTGFFGKLL